MSELSHDEEIRIAAMGMACQYLIAIATFGAAGPTAATEGAMYAECMEAANLFENYIRSGTPLAGSGLSDAVTGHGTGGR